ncbi:hypothetical protein [Candidatus Cyanaurora vandensis]|uniref:hypothetical protein n=1 Tax=Candidatus Cyanaurora vandensis TaxID=2714958 RepID=UPI00257E4EAE|nr:hypothetical protein [Candidatus Cyanaurora vandensis]
MTPSCTIRYSYTFILLPQWGAAGVGTLLLLILAVGLGWPLLLLLFVVPLGYALWCWLVYLNTYYILTPENITKCSGIWFKNSESIPVGSILKREVQVWLPGPDLGSIVLETAAQSSNNLTSVEGDLILSNVEQAPAIHATIAYLAGGSAPEGVTSPVEALGWLQAKVNQPVKQTKAQKSEAGPQRSGTGPLWENPWVWAGGVGVAAAMAVPLGLPFILPPTDRSPWSPYVPRGPLYGFEQNRGQQPVYWIGRITAVVPSADHVEFTLAWVGTKEANGAGAGTGNGTGRIRPDGTVLIEINEAIFSRQAAPTTMNLLPMGNNAPATQPLILEGRFVPQGQGVGFFSGSFIQRGSRYYPGRTWVLAPTPPAGWRNP